MKTWTKLIHHEPTGFPLWEVLLEFDGCTYRYRRTFSDHTEARAVMLAWRVVPGDTIPILADLTREWIPTGE